MYVIWRLSLRNIRHVMKLRGHPWLQVRHNIRASLRECRLFFFSIQVMTFGIKEKEENVETLCSKAWAHNVRGEALEEIAHRPVAGRLPERWDVHRAPTRNSNFVATVINAWNFFVCVCCWPPSHAAAVSECENMWAFVSAPIFYIIIGKMGGGGGETSGKYDFLLIVFRLCGGSEAQRFLNSLLEYRHNYYWSLCTAAYANTQLVLM